MRAETMANPIDTRRKTIGDDSIEPRGDRSERGENALLSGEDFAASLDKSRFDSEDGSAETLIENFYENGSRAFFQSFANREKTLAAFRRNFGESEKFFVEKAEKIVVGQFDLLGFENLDFGAEEIDWRFEPVSGKRSPLKHWKQFDEFSTDETGDRRIIHELNRCQHFFALGVAFLLTGDERYAQTFARHLSGWFEQNPPGAGINWSNSFEAAMRSISWIWALHFFKDSAHLTPALFLKTLASLDAHARHIEKYLSTYISPNYNLTGEALGLYYLGTQLPFFERAAARRETGAEILFAELDRQILPDGVYFEQSTAYQRYATDFYAHFYSLNQLNDGETRNDSQAKLAAKLQSALDFLMFATRPDGTTALLGDDDGGKTLPLGTGAHDDFRASLSTGAAIFRRGDYKFVAGAFAVETLWLLGADGEEIFENLPAAQPEKTSAAFTDGGYFVMRDGWTETDNYLLVDCGDFAPATNGAHNHADALSIDAAIGGKTLLADSGTYSFAEIAERNRLRSSEAHNTLTVDNQSQSEPSNAPFNWQTQAKTNVRQWISQPRFDFFEASHDGYERFGGALAAKHTRSVLFLKNDYWLMRDFVETLGEHDYRLDFHFAPNANPSIEATENGEQRVDENADENIGSKLICFGDNAAWEKESSRISPVYGKFVDAPLLKFTSKGVGSQEFFTFLLPRETGLAAPEASEIPIVGGRAFIIEYREEYRDVFVFADGAQTIRTELFASNFQFFWARLSAGERLPEEFVLIGGTRFSVGNRRVIDASQRLDWATARRFGDDLNVRTSGGDVFSRSLAPKKSSTYVLKK